MKSREYQSKHIDAVVSELPVYRSVLAQMPTGGGKTVEFAIIAQRYIRSFVETSSKAVLVLVHRQELMQQAAKTIKEICGIDATLITSEQKKFIVNRVYIGMVDSTISRLDLIHNVGLVIIDECHVANFNKMHNVFLEELIIGFSATPIATSKKEPLNKYYKCIITGPQIKELIELGFLAQNITRCPKEVVDATKFSIDSLKGDYNERQMSTEYRLPKFVTNVIKNYHKYCYGEKTIVFNVNIEHSREVAECFRACGFNAKHLASDNEAERAEILQWFKETEDAILCNVMIATVGFDEPTVRNIIVNFATLSLVKFIQCCGRGGRIIDEEFIEKYHSYYKYQLKLKSTFNIIDLGANYVRFGDWNDDRDWDYIFHNPERAKDGIAPCKTCPECEGLVHAAATICNLTNEKGEVCGYEFERIKTPEEMDLEEMIMITKGINIDDLMRKNKSKYEYYTMLDMGHEAVMGLLKEHPKPSEGKKQLAFRAYYAKCCDWWVKFMAVKREYQNKQSIEHCAWHIKRAKNNFDTILAKNLNIDETKEVEFHNKKQIEITPQKENGIPPILKLKTPNNHVGFLSQRDYKSVYGR